MVLSSNAVDRVLGIQTGNHGETHRPWTPGVRAISNVAIALALTIAWPAGLTSGQLSYDWSQRVGEGGATDDVGEADLLPSPPDFLSGGRRVIRKYGQRVRCAKRSRVGVGGRHERRDNVADNRHVQRELNVADGAEVACQPRDFDPRLTRQLHEGDRPTTVDTFTAGFPPQTLI